MLLLLALELHVLHCFGQLAHLSGLIYQLVDLHTTVVVVVDSVYLPLGELSLCDDLLNFSLLLGLHGQILSIQSRLTLSQHVHLWATNRPFLLLSELC